MSKYGPLRSYLEAQTVGERAMAFREIERVLGFTLPPSARKHQAWWANNVGTHVNARAWREAGWKTSRVDLASERVVFIRDALSSDGGSSKAIVIPLNYLDEAATRLLEKSGDPAQRAAELLNQAARRDRAALVARFAGMSPRMNGDSAEMIRADRDAR